MDKAREATDKRLKQIERELLRTYKEASALIRYEWDEYLRAIKPQGDALARQIAASERAGDEIHIAEAKEAYSAYLTRQTIASDRYRMMLDTIADNLARTNEQALQRVNAEMPWIYATNYNSVADDVNNIVRGYSFELVDEHTIRNLMTSDAALVPQKHIDIQKDKRWNKKLMNSQVTQGIMRGESIGTIADRIQTVTDANRDSAIRNARTITTSAENKGRLDSYKKAESDGLILTKVWMATCDERTRDAHAELDGQEVDINEAFVNSLGEIMYPGDPDASSENVWNCRCSMITNVKGYRGR